MSSLLNLKETKEAKNFIVDTLHNFKDDVRSVTNKVLAKDILPADQSLFDPSALSASAVGPAIILSVGLPLIGVYLAKKKHDSPLARKIAKFLGADVNSINEQLVFAQLHREEYYNELKKNLLSVITERGDISLLTKMLDLTEGEAWDLFYNIKEIVFRDEVLNQFSRIASSLSNITKDVNYVKNNLDILLDVMKSPIKESKDAESIANELRVHESAGIRYIRREEDSKLEQAILNNVNKVILMIGGPGSGKSKMLYNAMMYCREYFSTVILIKNYFREGDEKSLDLVLSEKDNFVIVWDDLHEKKPEFVSDVIERINSIGRSKNFRFIGASRRDIFVKSVYRLTLRRFEKIRELVGECANTFNVKIKLNVSPEKILSIGDGTPYYTISLFKMFKDGEISAESLNELQSNVIDLWQNYLETAIQNRTLNVNHLNAFRSVGLLLHASSEILQINKSRIREVYVQVFHGDAGGLDYALHGLVDNMFLSQVDQDIYYAHDSHIEALESIYPLEKVHIHDFIKHERNKRNLWTLNAWTFYKRKNEYLGIISSRIIEIDSKDDSAWINKGVALHGLDRSEEAIVCLDKALEISPKNTLAWINKGAFLHDSGNHDEALACLDKALEISPKDATASYNKGLVLGNLDRSEEAIVCLDKALEINPAYADAWFARGVSLFILKKYDESIKCYDKVIEIDANNANAWVNKAINLGFLDRSEEAIVCLDKALEINPAYADAWFARGIAQGVLGKPEEAIKCYDKVIEIDPKYVNALTNKGASLFNLGKPEEAIKCYDKVIEIDPKDASIWNKRGSALGSLSKYDEAIKCYDKVIEIDPKDASAWYNKGASLFNLGKPEEAINYFDRATEINPTVMSMWYYKGRCLDILGKPEEAIKCYDKVIEIDPKDASAWYNRACSKVKEGDIDDGLSDLKKAIEIDKDKIELAKQDKNCFENIRNDERFKALVMK